MLKSHPIFISPKMLHSPALATEVDPNNLDDDLVDAIDDGSMAEIFSELCDDILCGRISVGHDEQSNRRLSKDSDDSLKAELKGLLAGTHDHLSGLSGIIGEDSCSYLLLLMIVVVQIIRNM